LHSSFEIFGDEFLDKGTARDLFSAVFNQLACRLVPQVYAPKGVNSKNEGIGGIN
jgi:hypothetical protein